MRENRPSGSEGGVALRRHPYPYRKASCAGPGPMHPKAGFGRGFGVGSKP